MSKEYLEKRIGLKWDRLLYLANRSGSHTATDEAVVLFDNLMALLNERLGEIMGLRVELERREAKQRSKRVAERLRQESYGTRKKAPARVKR